MDVVVVVIVVAVSLLQLGIGALVVVGVFDAVVCSLQLWTCAGEVVVGIEAFC